MSQRSDSSMTRHRLLGRLVSDILNYIPVYMILNGDALLLRTRLRR